MPKVKLTEYTCQYAPDDLQAARLLVFTKNTRMNLEGSYDKVNLMTRSEILTEIDYMSRTIPSSWEFLDLTFVISQISRATAQQITRTRVGSYAMQSQRVTDMSEVTYDKRTPEYNSFMDTAINNYAAMLLAGMPLEDARELLPIGVHCSLVAKYNLRTLVELCLKRDSLRVQGPYREIVKQMREQVLTVWPWARPFFVPQQKKAIDLLEEASVEMRKLEKLDGALYQGVSGKLAKVADLLKV